MSAQSIVFETGHEEMIHDAQLDYYGKRLASASSDRTIKIFEVLGDKQNLVAHLKGHDGPVWQVNWAHPKFGVLLASCSYDGKVCVWKEHQQNQWAKIFENVTSPHASVNAVCWAPHTFGLVLAAACSDGSVVIYTHQDDQSWSQDKINDAHVGGCNSVSWGPDVAAGGSLGGQVQPVMTRFVTGGCDNKIKIWGLDRPQNGNPKWVERSNFQDENKHNEWVRDVAWAPSLGLLSNTIASCSEDKTVIIWYEENGTWRRSKVLEFPHKIWRVSWSPMGNILAVSQGDNKVSLWKETVDGEWKNLSTVEDEAKAE